MKNQGSALGDRCGWKIVPLEANKRGIKVREKREGWDNPYLGKSFKSECVCPERKSG